MNKEKLERLRSIHLKIDELERDTRLTHTRSIQVRLEGYGSISLSDSAIGVIKKIVLADQDARLVKLKREFQEG